MLNLVMHAKFYKANDAFLGILKVIIQLYEDFDFIQLLIKKGADPNAIGIVLSFLCFLIEFLKICLERCLSCLKFNLHGVHCLLV